MLAGNKLRSVLIAPYSPIGRSEISHLGAANKIESVRNILAHFGDVLHLNTAHNRVGYHASETHQFEGGLEVDLPSMGQRKTGKLLHWMLAPALGNWLVGKGRIDLIWVYNTYCADSRMALSQLKRRSQTKLVVEVEDWPDVRSRVGLGFWKERLDRRYLRKMLTAADLVTIVNPRMRFRKEMSRVRTVMDLACILSPELTGDIRAPNAALDGKRTIGYFGGLNTEKGVDLFFEVIRTFASNPEKRPFRFIVCGTGPLADEAMNLANTYPQCLEFHSGLPRKRVYELMRSCDAIINPHRPLHHNGEDGIFPFKVMEILASGARLVSTPLPEELVPRWAYIPIDCSAGAILSALRSMEDDRRMDPKAVSCLIEAYSEDAVAAKIAKTLGFVVRGRLDL